MHKYGFSTGALALGDYKRGMALLAAHHADAIELSALRDHELPQLSAAMRDIDVSGYRYVSVHAPSRFDTLSEEKCATLLRACIDLEWRVVLHPDAVRRPECWRDFGSLLCIENMDKRKPDGRTVEELGPWFEALPEASLCLDLGHARQVDASLIVARRILRAHGNRLSQIHLSQLDARSRHKPLSMGMATALQRIAHQVPLTAVILESQVAPAEIGEELRMAHLALDAHPSACDTAARA